jgi:hypothetical protein
MPLGVAPQQAATPTPGQAENQFSIGFNIGGAAGIL